MLLGRCVHAQDQNTCLCALELNHDNLNARMETVQSGISRICRELQEVTQRVSDNVARQMKEYFNQQVKQIPTIVSKATADLLSSDSGFKDAVDSSVAQTHE